MAKSHHKRKRRPNEVRSIPSNSESVVRPDYAWRRRQREEAERDFYRKYGGLGDAVPQGKPEFVDSDGVIHNYRRKSLTITPSPAKRFVAPVRQVSPLTRALNNVASVYPYREWVCFKRRMRKEVLFALDLVRKRGGAGGGRRRHFNLESYVRCER